jgi:hypothetical protein
MLRNNVNAFQLAALTLLAVFLLALGLVVTHPTVAGGPTTPQAGLRGVIADWAAPDANPSGGPTASCDWADPLNGLVPGNWADPLNNPCGHGPVGDWADPIDQGDTAWADPLDDTGHSNQG